MSRSPAKSRKATAMKLLKEKWLSMVQSAGEKGENRTGGSSIVTLAISLPTPLQLCPIPPKHPWPVLDIDKVLFSCDARGVQ